MKVVLGETEAEKWRVFGEKVKNGELLDKEDAVIFRKLSLLFPENPEWRPILDRARSLLPKKE